MTELPQHAPVGNVYTKDDKTALPHDNSNSNTNKTIIILTTMDGSTKNGSENHSSSHAMNTLEIRSPPTNQKGSYGLVTAT